MKSRTLGLFDLSVLGIGAIIGTGILVLTGIVAAQNAGPAIALSFLIAAIASGFIGLCYSELTTSVPNSGSAFFYAWVSIGNLTAFLAGWTLLGVYITTTATVANGWTGYFASFLKELNIVLPTKVLMTPINGGIINLPAVIMVILITIILTRGTNESKIFNDILVLVKLAIICLFLIVSIKDINIKNYQPFFPYKISGVFSGASAVFFSFLGFDALATSAEDAKNVNKALPRAIIISLTLSTLLYVLVGLVMTGVVKYKKLNVSEAMSYVLISKNHILAAQIVSFGAILGIMAVVFAFIYAGSNILKSMSREKFLPLQFAKLSAGTKTANYSIWLVGLISAILAGECDLHYLALISNIGSLLVFLLISIIVVIMRYKFPNLKRPFKIPGGKIIPILSVSVCIILLINISLDAWIAYFVWLVVGIVIYFLYSKKNANSFDVKLLNNV